MQKHIDKTQAEKSAPAAAGKAVRGKANPVLEDNRPQSIAQQKKSSEPAVEESVAEPLQQKANNTGLPDDLKSGIENLSGHSMDDVKVHYNSPQPEQLNAHAYAQGAEIHVAAGQEKQLPHEAWHVVQQKQGRVKPTMQLKQKVNINDDKTLEKEADTMGTKALHIPKSFVPAISTFVPAATTIQSRSITQLAKRKKGTISGHGGLLRKNDKRTTFKIPKNKSIMRPAPPGANLGDISMLLNTLRNPSRKDLMKHITVSTTRELWKNKALIKLISASTDIKRTDLQDKTLAKLESGLQYEDLVGKEKGSLTRLESNKTFESWATSHISPHLFQTFEGEETIDDMKFTPFPEDMRSGKNTQNHYVEDDTILSEYIAENPEIDDYIINACSYDKDAEFTGFQIDENEASAKKRKSKKK